MLQISKRHALLIVLMVAGAVYANSLWNGFAYDDVWIVEKNPEVHQLDLARIWGAPYWSEALGAYRPLTIFAFAVQWRLGGGVTWVFHLANLLLHTGISALVFLLLARLLNRGAALFGALIFAVHPVHTEAVANIVGQAELLAAAAVLGACLVYMTRESADAISWPRALAIAGLYAAGLFAKEGAIVLPGLLVILDLAERRVHWETWRGYLRASGGLAGILIATALCYFIARVEVLGTITSENSGPQLPFLREEHRILSALRVWPEYVRLLFFPFDLSADYSPAVILPVDSWTPLAVLGIVILGTTVLIAGITLWRPAVGTGAAWFMVAILPVSNLLFPIGVLMAERTLYLPSVAASLVAGYCGMALWPAIETRGRPLIGGVACLLLLLFSVRTIVRNPEWKSTETIFDATLRDHPESYVAQWSAATRKLESGDTLASRTHWEMAYRIWPMDGQFLAEYGSANLAWKRMDRAIDLLEKSRTLGLPQPDAQLRLGTAYVQAGRYRDALEVTEGVARLVGPSLLLFDIRGRAYHGLGEHDRAAAAFRAGIRQPRGDNWAIWLMLAHSLAAAGRRTEAAEALYAARSRAADDSVALRRIDQYWTNVERRPLLVESASGLQNATAPRVPEN